jgi:hypothetical protein
VTPRSTAPHRERLIGDTKGVFLCLHGLIQAVEKQTGKLGKLAAVVSSTLVLTLARFWSP